MKRHPHLDLIVVFCVLCLISARAMAGSNLLFNGSFDCPTNPLAGWMYDYTWLGNNLYMANHSYVSWLEKDGNRKGIAKLHGPNMAVLCDTGQGVWLDSKLVPYEYPYRYKVTMWARTEGPNARIFMCGVMWQPGLTPHPDPDLTEMSPKPPNRLIQQGSGHMVYFGKGETRYFSDVKGAWTRGETIFPDDNPSAEEIKRLKRVDFIFLHICALMGKPGDLLIDDVEIEKLNQKANVEAANAKKKSTSK
jgi:hypothetical protein